MKDKDGIFVDRRLDLSGLFARQGLAQIEAGDFADKMLVQLPDRNGHDASSKNFLRQVVLLRLIVKATPGRLHVNVSGACGAHGCHARAIGPYKSLIPDSQGARWCKMAPAFHRDHAQ
jgi:hypothetical protein